MPALIAALLVAAVWYVTELQTKKIYAQSLRSEVSLLVDEVRANLEIHLNSDLYLAQGLAAALSIEPDMSQQAFTKLAAEIFHNSKNLRNVAAAPDMVIKMIYPAKGNESTLGLDYNKLPAQRAAVLQARDTGTMILAGPVDLVQGGRAFIGRYPVYDMTDPKRPFWGLLAAVIDLDRLYSVSGLYNPYSDISVTLEKQDGLNDEATMFFGNIETIQNNPVQMDVRLPTGSWRISAVPKEGWKSEPPSLWVLRFAFLIAALMIVAPMLASTFLIHQRHEYIDVLSVQKSDLHRQSRRLHLAMEAAGAGVWEYDVEKKTIIWDARMNELYGYPPSFREHYHTDWAARIHPEDRARAEADFETGVGGRIHYRSVYRIILPNGDIRHVRSLANIIQFKGRTKIVGVNWDVSEETEMQESLEAANRDLKEKNFEIELARQRVEFLANHDSLTELPNRRFLDQLLEEHVKKYAAGTEYSGVLQIDLDGFKTVNDTLGHFAGDCVLNHVGNLLASIVDEKDHVIRLGGDEFIVFINRPNKAFFTQGKYLETLAEKIIRRLSVPLNVPSGKVTVGASIGIATDAISTTTPKSILRDADIALYESKISGRGQYKICDTDLRSTLDRKNKFQFEIETALSEGQIIPYYQPQYSGSDLSFFGVEALARWNHPTRGLLTPSDFLEHAKEIGRDADIDRAVLLRVLEDRLKWQKAGANVPRISVNVSARQIANPDILEDLKKLDIPRGAICFELVESIFMDDENKILKDNVAGLKEMGIEIEIDDFGTGFASIVALQKLRPMRLKIDNQLVAPISSSHAARKIVASLIEIGRSLDIEVIAEGIESQFHIDTLQSMGCHALQGYALCRPMSGDSFFELLQLDQLHLGEATIS